MTLTVAGAIVFGYAVSLGLKYVAWTWIVDAHGRPILEDFVTLWAAGKTALGGMALMAYDGHAQHAAEAATVGHGFDGLLGWYYPPVFLFAAAALASLPYALAFLTWMAGTLALYAAVVAAIVRRRLAFLVACAAPWVVTTILPGQNGFLTASLVGLVLLQLEKRPALAGLVLGLLSYKPQFGILFPLALAAGGYWRAFGWAAFGTLLWNVLAAWVFGFATLGGFFHGLEISTQIHLATDGLGWNKVLSVYSLACALGTSAAAASSIQLVTTCALGAGVVAAWRSDLPYALKTALLAAAIPLATPYLLIYDLPILAVALAFLFRHRAFDRLEFAIMALGSASLFPLPSFPLPLPLFASLAVCAMAARRIYVVTLRNRISPSWATEATSLPSSE